MAEARASGRRAAQAQGPLGGGDPGSAGAEGTAAAVEPFGSRFSRAVGDLGPLCAGIDPSADLLASWGLPDDAGGLRAFSSRCVEAFAGVLPAVKPQVAFFERHGASGMAALEELVASATDAGLLVVADAKRGDVGSTMAAYAEAWLDPRSPLAADAVTATPYVGLGALEPLFRAAAAGGRGVFVVVRSSNPEGRTVQEARTEGGSGPSVEDALLAELAARNGEGGVAASSLGAVVGATLEAKAAVAAIGGPVLAPGVGAQGATAEDVGRRFASCPPGSVLPSASRSLLAAGPEVRDLSRAAARLRDELAAALPSG